jgi:hypothetical protein
MLFSKIILENYGIYKDRQIFDFTTTQDYWLFRTGGKIKDLPVFVYAIVF